MLDRLSLDGRVVLITGGGTGLGLAMVRALARAGANVAIGGRRQGPIDAAAAEVKALGGESLAVSTDVTDSAQVDRLISSAVDRFGHMDVLINNAGAVQENVTKPIWEISDDEWSQVMDVNLTGAFYCARTAAKVMADRGSGKIINVASGFGLRAGRDIYMYCCSKGGMIQLTRVLSFSLARLGITANSIVPGFIPTASTDSDIPGHSSQVGRLPANRQVGPPGRPGSLGRIPGVSGFGLYDWRDVHRRRRRTGRGDRTHRTCARRAIGALTCPHSPNIACPVG